MNLKDNLKRIRKENNLSQEELAEKLNVSRQSVSKWEQGITYPEMDKMLEICKLFNLNIDDLLNGDINESNNTKQAKNNINKFIESFLGYVTKTVDMFSSMKFRNKFACFMEQCVIILCLYILFKLVGTVGGNIVSNLLYFLPSNAYNAIFKFIESIYAIVSIILGVILLLHIFKIRYLDYYEIIRSDDKEEVKETEDISEKKEEVKNKIYLEKKKEKVIIRDPKHSEYRFISGLLKLALFIFKLFALFIFGMLCVSLIFFSICFISLFILIKTGLLFVGSILIILSCILVNYVFLKIFYAFIFNDKLNKSNLMRIFFSSLILMGFGIGLIIISVPKYSVVNYNDKTYYLTETENINMVNDAFFINDNINYIESNNSDLKIEYIYLKNNEVVMEKLGNGYSIYIVPKESNIPTMMKDFINALVDKKILLDNDYGLYINIYTNKANIEKLKNNLVKFRENEQKLWCEYDKQSYENRINELENRIYALQNNCSVE